MPHPDLALVQGLFSIDSFVFVCGFPAAILLLFLVVWYLSLAEPTLSPSLSPQSDPLPFRGLKLSKSSQHLLVLFLQKAHFYTVVQRCCISVVLQESFAPRWSIRAVIEPSEGSPCSDLFAR